ncbi:triple tyrosine motif-containing protein [Oceanirhabdus sp. W0125-5]|uniref:triple tyrosine motif-containing protein n=1 Tax=Oceanirhabdus sp. W0125-5 TaxID=2999116 RepID=UPI0022F2DEFD|nr:triple tyrosine motif-containing protein [Oceanirhabdus sp. W0125-5]WBW98582.1 triple tyrosine motif-containing protein [Oceanirhabdus sp. W0125-5]
MDEIRLSIVPEKQQFQGRDINIQVINDTGESLEYKFLVGHESKWETVREFSGDNTLKWRFDKPGDYFIMVQAKKINSKQSFDYVTRSHYEILFKEMPFRMEEFNVDKDKLKVGEKLCISARSNRNDAVYKYMIKEDKGWRTLKDITKEGDLEYHFTTPGVKEISLKCFTTKGEGKKTISLTKKVEVEEKIQPKIKLIECSKNNLYVGRNINFKVKINQKEEDNILYKFIKVYPQGEIEILRDYSSNNNITLVEELKGEHVLICYIKDMFSLNEYDDRAKIVYRVKDGEKILIRELTTDLQSPQEIGTNIKIRAVTNTDSRLLYRFMIEKIEEKRVHVCNNIKYKEIEGNNKKEILKKFENSKILDSDYIASPYFFWKPEKEGRYNIKCIIKRKAAETPDDIKELEFNIKELAVQDERIEKVIFSEDINNILINNELNIRVEGTTPWMSEYRFIIFKDDKEIQRTEYSKDNEIDFIPREAGEFKLEIHIKGKKSKKELDSKELFILNVKEFIPGKIEYVLYDAREYYVHDKIKFEIVGNIAKEIVYKYNVYLNGVHVEQCDYSEHKAYDFKLLNSGRYRFEFFCKNIKSNEEQDYIKNINVNVIGSRPITESYIKCDRDNINIFDEITFQGECNIKENIIYEFYLYENDGWRVLQKYSAKDFFTFIPKKAGEYRILMLVKHINNNESYEHYCINKFNVNEK